MCKGASGYGYFDGKLSDGENSLRIVGFDAKVQQKLMDFHSRKEPVALVNCQVKESKFSSTLELHMRKNTEVLKSPTKLDASAITSNSSSDLITLDELPKLDQYQTVSGRKVKRKSRKVWWEIRLELGESLCGRIMWVC